MWSAGNFASTAARRARFCAGLCADFEAWMSCLSSSLRPGSARGVRVALSAGWGTGALALRHPTPNEQATATTRATERARTCARCHSRLHPSFRAQVHAGSGKAGPGPAKSCPWRRLQPSSRRVSRSSTVPMPSTTASSHVQFKQPVRVCLTVVTFRLCRGMCTSAVRARRARSASGCDADPEGVTLAASASRVLLGRAFCSRTRTITLHDRDLAVSRAPTLCR